MTAINNKLKDESSRAISSLLVSTLEACRQGDVNLAEGLGLSLQTVRLLDSLKADQITNISGNYMRDQTPLELFKIDSVKISKIIEIAAEESKLYEMIDEFLRHGACKKMMLELFGLRSTQVANRKRYLNLPTVKGRLTTITTEEGRAIYDCWLVNMKVNDLRQRLLTTSKATGLTLSKVYKFVQEAEEITNQINSKRQFAA